MNVTFEADRAHQEVFDDEEFQFVIEHASRTKPMLLFVAASIRRFESLEEVLRGKPGSKQNMESYANSFLKDKRSRSNGVAVAQRLARLYGRFDAGNVRGCLIESMIQGRLRERYQQTRLENNVFVTLTNDVTYRTSTSVDVAGYDGQRGECHDCKAQGRKVDTTWIEELVTNLVPHSFRIGVATAESPRVAVQGMSTGGYQIPATLTVTGPETWWDGLPLWRT
jgi:hypothetical protein